MFTLAKRLRPQANCYTILHWLGIRTVNTCMAWMQRACACIYANVSCYGTICIILYYRYYSKICNHMSRWFRCCVYRVWRRDYFIAMSIGDGLYWLAWIEVEATVTSMLFWQLPQTQAQHSSLWSLSIPHTLLHQSPPASEDLENMLLETIPSLQGSEQLLCLLWDPTLSPQGWLAHWDRRVLFLEHTIMIDTWGHFIISNYFCNEN